MEVAVTSKWSYLDLRDVAQVCRQTHVHTSIVPVLTHTHLHQINNTNLFEV